MRDTEELTDAVSCKVRFVFTTGRDQDIRDTYVFSSS